MTFLGKGAAVKGGFEGSENAALPRVLKPPCVTRRTESMTGRHRHWLTAHIKCIHFDDVNCNCNMKKFEKQPTSSYWRCQWCVPSNQHVHPRAHHVHDIVLRLAPTL